MFKGSHSPEPAQCSKVYGGRPGGIEDEQARRISFLHHGEFSSDGHTPRMFHSVPDQYGKFDFKDGSHTLGNEIMREVRRAKRNLK